MAEVEETLKRIQSHKGVIGTMVVNAEGIPIRTTLDNSTTVQYAGLLHQLTVKAKSTVRDIDPQNDLTFLRIRSKKHEIMVAPEEEKEKEEEEEKKRKEHQQLLTFVDYLPCDRHFGFSPQPQFTDRNTTS
ncbi:hypothetical protein J1605_006809 [Eschrichtius robustus]|uniref:Roadblock/LAMTOR2 domain-containing protein n=1 Tax=Eschrichtius robustus TaxID=9764 RepID=A0AB34H2I6_ESCRO|nr:hypothetical protein J1605_006809 [Eschrichtius robustus]